jgi:hypothetical protein
MRVKMGKEQLLKPEPKHVLIVYVWAAISKRGATNICMFDQIKDGAVYVQILDGFLVPFLDKVFPDGQYRFMQDNDPKHCCYADKDYY